MDEQLVFYGPHQCATCGPLPGSMIVKVSRDQGGAEYDYPEGPIYPNTIWEPHVHRTYDKPQENAT